MNKSINNSIPFWIKWPILVFTWIVLIMFIPLIPILSIFLVKEICDTMFAVAPSMVFSVISGIVVAIVYIGTLSHTSFFGLSNIKEFSS